MDAPRIQPINEVEYESKQSKYHHCGKLPIRSIILGPSGSGKTVLLQNLVLDIYRGCFSRIYVFSPPIEVDSSWVPVKKDIEENAKKPLARLLITTLEVLGKAVSPCPLKRTGPQEARHSASRVKRGAGGRN